jgi:mannan endo-1,4-beta-mannosidase
MAALLLLGLLPGACIAGSDEPLLEQESMPIVRQPPTPPPCVPRAAIGPAFVRRDGSSLRLEDQPFRALGANAYYLQQLFAYGEAGRSNSVEPALEVLDHMVCLGMGVVRMLAFNDGDDASAIRTEPGAYHEVGLRGLDRAVAEAKARGLRVILPLVNNWSDYGGLPRYATWAGKLESERDEFFADGPMRDTWKEYVAMLTERVNTYTGVRYRDEPAILAWEIGNELRCPTCPGSTRYVDTMNDLADYLKGHAPEHLIADGGDGLDDNLREYRGLSNPYWVRGSEGTSFSKLLEIEALDLVSYHMYFSRRGFRVASDLDVWIDSHERLARTAGKVAYLGEFGVEPASSEPASSDAERAASLERQLERLFAHNAGALALFWQLIPAARRPSSDDGYGVVFDQDPATSAVLHHWARVARP